MTAPVKLIGLPLEITRELSRLRMWRQMGDTLGEDRCNDRINALLDRYSTPAAANAERSH